MDFAQPYTDTAESVFEIIRFKEMITNLRCFGFLNEISLSVPEERYGEDFE